MPDLSLRPSSKGVVVLAIVAAMIMFGCILSYVAAAGKLKAAMDELNEKEKTVAASKQMVQKLEKTRLNYLDACSQVRYLESGVSTRTYVPTLLKQIEQLGKSVNLRVLGVRPEETSESSSRTFSSGAKAAEGNTEAAAKPGSPNKTAAKSHPYNELKIKLELEGTYMRALDFLYKLTTFPKIVAVNGIEVSPAKTTQSSGSPILNIKMTVTAFILRDDHATPIAAPAYSENASVKGGCRDEAG